MGSKSYKLGRFFLGRLDQDSTIMSSIAGIARKKRVKMAVFSIIGSVKYARLGYYDQTKHEYRIMKLDQPLSLASCFGNLSFSGNKPFIHIHSVLADDKGKTYAGHMMNAKVFSAELHLQELLGERLEREYISSTGLPLWEFKK